MTYRIRTARCACCGLDASIATDLQAGAGPTAGSTTCARCRRHRDEPAARDRDHASLYRRALDDARDQLGLAEGERDFYRDRSVTSARSGETLVRVLAQLDDLHHDRQGRCSCGEPDCRVHALVGDPAVARLIGTYDEEQCTLYELRRANPGAGAPEWDYIDVTLVYPPRSERPGGRHRAAG